MQQSTRYAVVAIIICLIGLGLYALVTKPQPPDQELIQQQIVSAIGAANAGSTQGILNVVSDEYKDTEGHGKDELRAELIQGFSKTNDYQFQVSSPIIVVSGTTATSDCTLIIDDRSTGQQVLTRDVHVQWGQEQGRKWFVVPIKVWRATSSDLSVPTALD